MPRPCKDRHELSPKWCAMCAWCLSRTAKGAAYRALWQEAEPPGPVDVPTAPIRQAFNRTTPCMHIGGDTGERFKCTTCRGRVELKLLGCGIHGHCTAEKVIPGVQCCRLCPDYLPDPISDPEARPVPASWAHTPPVMARHQKALKDLCNVNWGRPPLAAGDGVVLCGGGRLWKMMQVSIRMLRDVSGLPVQVWHCGDAEPVNPADLAGVPGVTYHDTTKLLPRPRVCRAGWETKALALLHCGLRRVLYLDADAYCVTDPAPFLALAGQGRFAYWADMPHHDTVVRWDFYGMDRNSGQNIPPIQGGQLAIDRLLFWRELRLFHWLCMHSDWSFSGGYGDQDQWRVALNATGGTFQSLGRAPWIFPAFICSYASTSVIIHRCRGKMHGDSTDIVTTHLPGDDRAWKYLRGK